MFISRVEAVNELLLTTPDLVRKTPLGLTKITFPFEFTLPAMLDGVEPRTLLSEDDEDEGILKSTTPPECTENESQCIIEVLLL